MPPDSELAASEATEAEPQSLGSPSRAQASHYLMSVSRVTSQNILYYINTCQSWSNVSHIALNLPRKIFIVTFVILSLNVTRLDRVRII